MSGQFQLSRHVSRHLWPKRSRCSTVGLCFQTIMTCLMCNSPEEQESLTHVEFTRAPSWPIWDTDTLVLFHVHGAAALDLLPSRDNQLQSLRKDRKNLLSLSRCFSTNWFSSKRIRANLSDWDCADGVTESMIHWLDPWGSTSSFIKGLLAKQTNKQTINKSS